MRWYKCGTVRCSRRSKAMPTNWNGSSTSVSTTKANAIRMTRIMKSFVAFGNAARRTSRAIARRLYATQPGRDKKMRPRSDAATDGDRWGRVIDDGGPDQARVEPNPALLRLRDKPDLSTGRAAFAVLWRQRHKR